MEPNINLAGSNSGKSKLTLLPTYFRLIGLGILLLTILYPVIFSFIDPESLKAQKAMIKMILLSMANLGLFLIAISREKNENEMIMNLRIRSLIFACFLGIIQTILEPVKDLVIGEPLEDSNSQGLVLMCLLMYLGLFFLQKKALPKGAANSARIK